MPSMIKKTYGGLGRASRFSPLTPKAVLQAFQEEYLKKVNQEEYLKKVNQDVTLIPGFDICFNAYVTEINKQGEKFFGALASIIEEHSEKEILLPTFITDYFESKIACMKEVRLYAVRLDALFTGKLNDDLSDLKLQSLLTVESRLEALLDSPSDLGFAGQFFETQLTIISKDAFIKIKQEGGGVDKKKYNEMLIQQLQKYTEQKPYIRLMLEKDMLDFKLNPYKGNPDSIEGADLCETIFDWSNKCSILSAPGAVEYAITVLDALKGDDNHIALYLKEEAINKELSNLLAKVEKITPESQGAIKQIEEQKKALAALPENVIALAGTLRTERAAEINEEIGRLDRILKDKEAEALAAEAAAAVRIQSAVRGRKGRQEAAAEAERPITPPSTPPRSRSPLPAQAENAAATTIQSAVRGRKGRQEAAAAAQAAAEAAAEAERPITPPSTPPRSRSPLPAQAEKAEAAAAVAVAEQAVALAVADWEALAAADGDDLESKKTEEKEAVDCGVTDTDRQKIKNRVFEILKKREQKKQKQQKHKQQHNPGTSRQGEYDIYLAFAEDGLEKAKAQAAQAAAEAAQAAAEAAQAAKAEAAAAQAAAAVAQAAAEAAQAAQAEAKAAREAAAVRIQSAVRGRKGRQEAAAQAAEQAAAAVRIQSAVRGRKGRQEAAAQAAAEAFKSIQKQSNYASRLRRLALGACLLPPVFLPAFLYTAVCWSLERKKVMNNIGRSHIPNMASGQKQDVIDENNMSGFDTALVKAEYYMPLDAFSDKVGTRSLVFPFAGAVAAGLTAHYSVVGASLATKAVASAGTLITLMTGHALVAPTALAVIAAGSGVGFCVLGLVGLAVFAFMHYQEKGNLKKEQAVKQAVKQAAEAATTIQRVARGYLGRQQVEAVKKAAEVSLPAASSSVTPALPRIQAS